MRGSADKRRIKINNIDDMKQLLTLLTLFPLFLVAQNISIVSFKSVPDDMTARVTAPVTDQNGDKCALIKVKTTQTGFVFEGDMMGIEKTEQKTAEIWVYVPHGAKKLSIAHQQLGRLDNYLYTEPIKETTVYEMVLTSAQVVTTVVQEEIKTAYLIIQSQPEGADVYIDDAYMGTTPFNKKMTAGSYNYRVEMLMYNATAGKIEITGANPREELNLTLAPNFGTVDITTTPETGANIVIDGEPVEQKTPVTGIKLKPGTHRATLKLPMYQPLTKEFTITAGQTTNLSVELIPSFATVTINTSPAADIYIDAEKVGSGTYTGRVMGGLHSFSATKDKYNEAKQQLELETGQSKTINLTLQPKTGTLDIMTKLMNATIKLNGVEKGKTPNTLKGLMIGQYNLTLEKNGFDALSKTITITENKTTQLNETLVEQKKKEPVVAQTQKNDEKQTQSKPTYSAKATKYKKTKNTFYTLSAVTAGVGGYFAYNANNLYNNDYQSATTEATNLHKQIENQMLISYASFGISAGCLVTAIIFNSKHKKAANIKADIVPMKNGVSINLTYNF